MAGRRCRSLFAWVNSFDVIKKVDNWSQLSDGVILSECLRLLEFCPDDTVGQSPLEFVVNKLSDFYGCDLAKSGVLNLAQISAGREEDVAKVVVLLLCVAVKLSENEHFIEAIRSLPDTVQFDLKYFIEATLEQIGEEEFALGMFNLDLDKHCATPIYNVSSCRKLPITSPALQSWLCSPCTSDVLTPKASNSELFESLELKEVQHQLKLMEKEVGIQRSLVLECEQEIELLSEEKNGFIISIAQKDERIHQLEEQCEELDHLKDNEVKLQKAQLENKNLERQLELAKEENQERNELQRKVISQDEEIKELNQAKNVFQVKLLKYQHQVQELEFENKSQQAQGARHLKRYNEALQKVQLLERQISELQDNFISGKEALALATNERALFQQENGRLSDELSLFQEQYATVMCSVGSKGQEIEQLQHTLKEAEERHLSELETKQQQLDIVKEQLSLLTTRVESLLAENQKQAAEFDAREAKLKAELQEQSNLNEAKCIALSTQVSSAEEMIHSCQVTISSLTRKRNEDSSLAAEKFSGLETTYQEKVGCLEQKFLISQETADQKASQLKQCLLEEEVQSQKVKESLQQEIKQQSKQLEQYRETITLSMSDHAEAEEWHQKEIKKCLEEMDTLNSMHKLEVMKLSRQLEELGKVNKELSEAITQEREEFDMRFAGKESEYIDLQNLLSNQEQDCVDRLCKLTEEKEQLLDLKQSELVAKQQMEQLCGKEAAMAAEYQAYRIVMEEKEVGLLHDIIELKQEKVAIEQRSDQQSKQLEQYCETVTSLERKLSSLLSDHVEAEEKHQRELQQCLDKHDDERKLKVVELSQRLKMMDQRNKELDEMIIQEREEFDMRFASKESEYIDLQNLLSNQAQDHVDQLCKLTEEKEHLSIDLKHSQVVAKQQVEQLICEQEMLGKQLEQLHCKEAAMAADYQAYRSVMEEKEVSLSHDMIELKQEKEVALQKLKLMEEEYKKCVTQINNLNCTLCHIQDQYKLEYQADVDSRSSIINQLQDKNKLLLQEVDAVKQDLLMVTEQLQLAQSCLHQEEVEKLSWQQQAKQKDEDLHRLHELLASKELSVQKLSTDLCTIKQDYCIASAALEHKKDELRHLEKGHEAYKKNSSTLLEGREATIGLLQSQLTSGKVELHTIQKENEELLKSVDRLYSQQAAANSTLEQQCHKRFSLLEQDNDTKLEEIAKMQVEMTSVLNELKELKLNHKEVIDCLNVEVDKNNSLEHEIKHLKATNKAYEIENAHLNKQLVQQKYGVHSRPIDEDEQDHLQQLHTEIDQLSDRAPKMRGDGNRLEELRTRNLFHPPHLKSCYPIELQLQCGTPKSSELQLKSVGEKKTSCFEISPPRKRNTTSRPQQHDSPDCARRRLSAPPTPTSRPSVARKMQLRSYLDDEQDENKPPSRQSDVFEIGVSLDEQSKVKMEDRKSKMFLRMAATRKSQQLVQRPTTKPLRTRNAPKKKT